MTEFLVFNICGKKITTVDKNILICVKLYNKFYILNYITESNNFWEHSNSLKSTCMLHFLPSDPLRKINLLVNHRHEWLLGKLHNYHEKCHDLKALEGFHSMGNWDKSSQANEGATKRGLSNNNQFHAYIILVHPCMLVGTKQCDCLPPVSSVCRHHLTFLVCNSNLKVQAEKPLSQLRIPTGFGFKHLHQMTVRERSCVCCVPRLDCRSRVRRGQLSYALLRVHSAGPTLGLDSPAACSRASLWRVWKCICSYNCISYYPLKIGLKPHTHSFTALRDEHSSKSPGREDCVGRCDCLCGKPWSAFVWFIAALVLILLVGKRVCLCVHVHVSLCSPLCFALLSLIFLSSICACKSFSFCLICSFTLSFCLRSSPWKLNKNKERARWLPAFIGFTAVARSSTPMSILPEIHTCWKAPVQFREPWGCTSPSPQHHERSSFAAVNPRTGSGPFAKLSASLSHYYLAEEPLHLGISSGYLK